MMNMIKLTSRRVFEAVLSLMSTLWLVPQKGQLSWYYLLRIGRKNLLRSRSRTAVTIGAIAAGTCAIVLLVGFAYGLQGIVTKRLVLPNSLRLADVQSRSTAHKLDTESINKLSELTGVEVVAPAVNLAGSAKLGDSQTEVVIIAVRNAFLQAANVDLVAGQFFSEEAELVYHGETPDYEEMLDGVKEIEGLVAGLATSFEPAIGERVNDQVVSFRIDDETYVPLRAQPGASAPIVGYVRGSILETYRGYRVWGGVYESVNTAGRQFQQASGEWLGEWLAVEQLPLYQEIAPTVYLPAVDDSGVQQLGNGYLTQRSLALLSEREAQSNEILELLYHQNKSSGEVLGEATTSAELPTDDKNSAIDSAGSQSNLDTSDLTSLVIDSTATTSAQDQRALESLVATNDSVPATASAATLVVQVAKSKGKEVLVSTAFLKSFELDPTAVLGKEISLTYIVGAGLVPGMAGRVVSEPVTYTVVGVFPDDEQAMLYAPLSDIESMGVNKYSLAKILANHDSDLPFAREQISVLGFSTRSIADTLQQVNRLFGIMRFLLGSFGMIAFIVALFGMFNTLTVSLLERTREIGVMKTLGTTDTDIVRLLMVESSLIGFGGGALGVGLGLAVGLFLNILTAQFRADKSIALFDFPPLFLICVFILAGVVGMMTGLYPARRAKKISALNALRYE